MAKASPALVNFNSGEFSPLLDARIDFQKYGNGCRTLDNFICTVQGPAKQRPGNRFVAEVKDSTKRPWLARFEFNVANAYAIEFGDQYLRFFTQHGRLESPPGTPVEVATPYVQADLFNTDQTCRLRTAQSGDFLYIAHGNYEPELLTRTTSTSFSLSAFRPNGGPFKDLNDTAITVYASAETGTGISLTASTTGVFLAGHVGALFYLEGKGVNSIPAWEVGKSVTAGNRRRSDGKTYEALNTATTGTFKPVHTSGALYDGDSGVQWAFRDAGFGWGRITAVLPDGSGATMDVLSRLPNQVVGSGNATTRWAHAAWSAVEGWPTDVAFFRERLWFARRSQLWASVASDFSDFSAKNPSGEVTADQAISMTLASGQINDVQWLLPDKELLAGTAGGEFSIGELSNGNALGPGNVRARLQSQFGSRAIVPVQAGATTLFIQRAGRKVREITYDSFNAVYQSTDRTALAEHITVSGVVDMDYAQEPDSVVWCARADGTLIGFTWNAEQNVWGWHRHTLGGSGRVESICTIPSPDQARNEPWMIVRRTINGVTRRYVEYQEAAWSPEQPQTQAFYVDCGLTYSGSPATSISGLGHLEGQTVAILADGSPHPNRVVTGGAVALQRAASVVHVGLPMVARLQPMRVEAGAQDGTAQGKTKRAHRVVFRFDNTSSGKFGPDEDHLDEITFRKPNDRMDQPVPAFTGDKVLSWPGGYSTDAYYWFVNDKPLPATVVGIFPQVTTQDAR